MLCKKPDIKYVDMCIWVDKNVYRDNLSEAEQEQIYQYIYHITRMLAYKASLFARKSYYEDFSIYSATRTYLRLTNPKQYELKEDGTPKLKKIKSVLNYIKAIQYPHKVDFEQEFYCQVLEDTPEETEVSDVRGYTFNDKLHEYSDQLDLVEFRMCLSDITQIVKHVLSRIPYKRTSAEWHNIYVSCLLTLINAVTLPNVEKARISKFREEYMLKTVESLYKKQTSLPPVLYHLDEDLADYIQVLVTTIRHAIAKDLSVSTHTYIPSNANANKLLLADINSEEYDYDE